MYQQRLGIGDLHKKNSTEIYGMLSSMAVGLTLAQPELKCLGRAEVLRGWLPSVCVQS